MLPRRPLHRPRPAAALLLALALVATGCGSGEDSGEKEPSKAASACRDRWKDLADDVSGRDERTNPSALAQRWTSVSATIDYYATSARGSDCGDALDDVDEAMGDLTAFGSKLSAYDMELRLQQVRPAAEKYADGPQPVAPKPSLTPARKGKKAKGNKARKAPLPPKPADIARALSTLEKQAPRATEQQEAGWQQARVVELGDSKAVAKAVKDLAFLSSESAAYRASTAALAQISAALKAAGD